MIEYINSSKSDGSHEVADSDSDDSNDWTSSATFFNSNKSLRESVSGPSEMGEDTEHSIAIPH